MVDKGDVQTSPAGETSTNGSEQADGSSDVGCDWLLLVDRDLLVHQRSLLEWGVWVLLVDWLGLGDDESLGLFDHDQRRHDLAESVLDRGIGSDEYHDREEDGKHLPWINILWVLFVDFGLSQESLDALISRV